MFGGVLEDELEHYSEVFADTGSNVQVLYIQTQRHCVCMRIDTL